MLALAEVFHERELFDVDLRVAQVFSGVEEQAAASLLACAARGLALPLVLFVEQPLNNSRS